MSSRMLAVALLVLGGPALAQSGFGDPTRPTSLSEPEPERERVVEGPRWRLQSTLVADQRRLAVINGRTVVQGSQVDGARLVEVRQDGVTLEADGQRIDVRLPGAMNIKRSGR